LSVNGQVPFSFVPWCLCGDGIFRIGEERVMATREELLKEIGELAHHNEKTYFG
jgi:hypothetical protein